MAMANTPHRGTYLTSRVELSGSAVWRMQGVECNLGPAMDSAMAYTSGISANCDLQVAILTERPRIVLVCGIAFCLSSHSAKPIASPSLHHATAFPRQAPSQLHGCIEVRSERIAKQEEVATQREPTDFLLRLGLYVAIGIVVNWAAWIGLGMVRSQVDSLPLV